MAWLVGWARGQAVRGRDPSCLMVAVTFGLLCTLRKGLATKGLLWEAEASVLCSFCARADFCHSWMQDRAPGDMLQPPDCEPHCSANKLVPLGDQGPVVPGLTFMLVAHDNCCGLAPINGADVSAGCVQVGDEDLYAGVRQFGTASLVSALRHTLESPGHYCQSSNGRRYTEYYSNNLAAQCHTGLCGPGRCKLATWPVQPHIVAGRQAIRHIVNGAQVVCHNMPDSLPACQTICWLTSQGRECCTTAPQASPGSLHS